VKQTFLWLFVLVAVLIATELRSIPAEREHMLSAADEQEMQHLLEQEMQRFPVIRIPAPPGAR